MNASAVNVTKQVPNQTEEKSEYSRRRSLFFFSRISIAALFKRGTVFLAE